MTSRPLGYVCRDAGDAPGCLETPDDTYTMFFDDIGESPIFWCAHCGPRAKRMDAALVAGLNESPERASEIETAINQAVERATEKLH